MTISSRTEPDQRSPLAELLKVSRDKKFKKLPLRLRSSNLQLLRTLMVKTIATTTAETNKLFGFRGGDDAEFAGRGRGGQGRGGAPKTGGRKGVKQALKKTDMDFPTL